MEGLIETESIRGFSIGLAIGEAERSYMLVSRKRSNALRESTPIVHAKLH